MTIRAYCDAAYALILAEYQRAGMSLEDALEKLEAWAVSFGRSEEERAEERIARQNAREMERFQTMMAGLGA